jgi:hypothetical protein
MCAALMQDLVGPEPFGQVSLALSRVEYLTRWGQHYLPSLHGAHTRQACNSFKDPGPLQYGTDSPLFIRCRDALSSAFDDLPAPEPSNIGIPGGAARHTLARYIPTPFKGLNPNSTCTISFTLILPPTPPHSPADTRSHAHREGDINPGKNSSSSPLTIRTTTPEPANSASNSSEVHFNNISDDSSHRDLEELHSRGSTTPEQ